MINNTLNLSNQTTTSSFLQKKKPATPVSGMFTVPKPAGAGGVSGTNLSSAIASLNKTIAPVAKPSPVVQPTQQTYTPPVVAPAVATPPPVAQSKPISQPVPVRGLFPDVSTSLYGGLVGEGQKQLAEAAKVGGEAGALRAQIQRDTQGVMGDRNKSMPVKIGQAGIIQQNLGTQLTGLAAEQEALKGTGQSFLDAAGAVKTEPTSFGQTIFDPVTGQFKGGGSNLDPQTAATELAQKVSSGQMTYEQAVSSLGYAGSAGQQFLNNAIKQVNPNFNIPQATASVDANKGIVGQATTDISNMQTNLQAADTNLAQLTDLATKSGLNDLSSITGNKITNLFRREFSDQALYSYQALLSGTRALYTAVLESRANLAPTDAYNIAKDLVPENISIGALKDLTNTLKTEAQTIITAKQQQIQGSQGATPGAVPGGGVPSGSGLFSW